MRSGNDTGEKECELKEYCIDPDGFLVIQNVSLQHDRNFTVILLNTTKQRFSPNHVHTIVTVKPYQTHPYIEGCEKDKRVCFKSISGPFDLTCSVIEARPTVHLEWFIRSLNEDFMLASDQNVSRNNFLFNTRATLSNIKYDTKEVVVYLCKTISSPSLLVNEESMVLVKGALRNFTNVVPDTKYVEYSKPLHLICTDQVVLYTVWVRRIPGGNLQHIIDILFAINERVSRSYVSDFHLGNKTSLLKSYVDETDEGLYICNFGDGRSEEVKTFDVLVYEYSHSAHPFVEGCSHRYHCAIPVPREGNLTCVIEGIRPTVKLAWETPRNSFVKFFNDQFMVKRSGMKHDAFLTSSFRIQDGLQTTFTLLCKATDYGGSSSLSTIIYLTPLVDQDQVEDQKSDRDENQSEDRKSLGFISLSVLLLPVLVGIYLVYKRRSRSERTQTNTDAEEAVPMMHREQPCAGKIRIFKEELTTKYSNTWERIHPLPYDETVSYALNDLFIEGGIEHLKNVENESFGKFCIWQKLDNRNEFLKSLRQRQSETVLEGEPGFGKTTLGYQLAFDWATNNSSSPLKDVDIYILLRLRYVKDVLSIPAAIKKLLLPGKSSLTIQDISNILYHSQSVVIFLDGYNRFSHNKDEKLAILKDVRTNNICSKCQVIVTTKPFLLPDEDTKDMMRMRLTGFGEMSWRKYLQKSVARNDRAEEERIMNIINSNPLLRDLCQVPLFFVLFAHITTKHGDFSKQRDHVDGNDDDDNNDDDDDDSKIDTVTKFFQTVIDRFQSSLDPKTVNDHSALSSVCFDELCDAEEGLIWKKERLCRRLGQTLYREYLRVGLIVEREFCRYKGSSQTQKFCYETIVRFPHDVFCEWFAAKKLAKVLQNTSQNECKKLFEKINPFDHQYVYRFACAFDVEAARKIIKYIQNLKDGEKFAILCILEQPEEYWNVEDTINNICSSPVVITCYDSLFLQRSTVQLLQFASDKNIKIECVWLGKTNTTFDVNKASLKLSSGIILPKLSTLSQFSVSDSGREMSKDDLIGFLEYVSLCDSLKDLRFRECLLPFSPLEDPDVTKYIIGKKPIDVQWKIPVLEQYWYTLDIQSGGWCHKNQTMSKEKYDQVVLSFAASFKTGHNTNDFSDDSGAGASSSAQSFNHLNRHEVGEETETADTAQAGPCTL